MCISFASAILHLRIYPTDIDASLQNDLGIKLFSLAFLVTTQEEKSQMSISRELIKFNGLLCIY